MDVSKTSFLRCECLKDVFCTLYMSQRRSTFTGKNIKLKLTEANQSYCFSYILDCTRDTCFGISRHAHFKNFGYALLTLFRVSTGDNWSGLLKVFQHV